jgi:hypothetical protein
LAFQASVTSPQALSARILWGLKNLPKISVFFSQNYQMIQKALELHTVGLKSFLGAKNVEKFRPNLVHFCYRF